jgi:hypothetical protein
MILLLLKGFSLPQLLTGRLLYLQHYIAEANREPFDNQKQRSVIIKLPYLRMLLLLIASLSFAGKAAADDGGITFGGSPHLLKGHASVSMRSEAVDIDIHDKVVKVDCRFVFHNSAKTCKVRMGFPDQGLGAEEPYQGEPVPTGPGLKAAFLSYDSWVNGKKVGTKLVPTDDRSLYWHTKEVTFKGGSDCLIRDSYTLTPGSQVTSENGLYRQTSYVLHTGASWHGPIGKALVTIKFAPDAISTPIKVKALSSTGKNDPRYLKWSEFPSGTVLYEGSSTAQVAGQTIRFTKTNFVPGSKDDIKVYYAFRMLKNLPY